MKERKRIAIYIDYSIRIPNFKKSYEAFKESLFKDNSSIEYDDIIENDVRFFWSLELKNPEVEKFYISKMVDSIKDEELFGNFQPYFFNDIHLNKFLQEYSYNIYSDCEIPSFNDITLLNICQSELFDVTLIDKFSTVRKTANTFFFLAKIGIYPRNVIFLGPKQELNHENFIGVWNPIINESQRNSKDLSLFLDWLKDLEKKYNDNATNQT